MMTCARCRRLLSRAHDGRAQRAPDARTRARLQAHLAACATCAEARAAYARVDDQLAGAFRVGPDVRFRQAVLAATLDRPVISPGSRSSLLGLGGRLVMGSLAGASLAIVLLVVLTLASALPSRQVARRGQLAQVAPTRVVHPRTAGAGTLPHVDRVKLSSATPAPHPSATVTEPAPGSALVKATGTVPPPLPDRARAIRLVPEATLAAGEVHDPLWSPDSRSLLYLVDFTVDPVSGWYTGVLVRYGPSGTLTLARGVRNFAWSPDSRLIAYSTQATPAPRGSSGAAEAQELHLVDADGAHDRVLTGIDRASVQFIPASGSPRAVLAVQHGVVVRIDLHTGQSTPLAHLPALRVAAEDTAFWALSANGRFFAYQDSHGLRVWDRDWLGPDGAQRAPPQLVLRQQLAPLGQGSFHFTWDGNALFFSTFDGHYTTLFRQSLAPLGPKVALNDNRPLHGPIVLVGPPSADCAIANFRIGSGALARNYVIDARHGPAHALLPPGGVGTVGYWSPDGRRLVYTIYRDQEAVRSAIARVDRG